MWLKTSGVPVGCGRSLLKSEGLHAGQAGSRTAPVTGDALRLFRWLHQQPSSAGGAKRQA